MISSISRVVQKLRRYFNDNIVSTSFAPLLPVWLFIFSLKLKKSLELLQVKSAVTPALFKTDSSL